MKFVVLAVLFLVATSAFASREHGKNKEEHKKKMGECKYIDTVKNEYNLRLLDAQAVTDLSYFDPTTSNTFYFSPCGTVSGIYGCPNSSSVCLVTKSGKAINYGTKPIVFADAVQFKNSHGFEGAYGNGELCNNGAPRRTFVEYVCDYSKTEAMNAIVNVTMADECTATFVIESAYACPVDLYCQQLYSASECQSSEQAGLCEWKNGFCQKNEEGCWGSRLRASGLFAILLISTAGVLLLCTVGLCLCACRKRRRCRRAAALANKKKCSAARKSSKSSKKSSKKVTKKEDAYEYAPFQMPFQLVPGSAAPINPYSNIQGYPMVNLAAPKVEENEQV